MSKSKGFSDTSVGRYSLALYELAEESNATHEIEKDSSSIIQLTSNSENFNLLIMSKKVLLLKTDIVKLFIINYFYEYYNKKSPLIIQRL